jgi:hypothetical protein
MNVRRLCHEGLPKKTGNNISVWNQLNWPQFAESYIIVHAKSDITDKIQQIAVHINYEIQAYASKGKEEGMLITLG